MSRNQLICHSVGLLAESQLSCNLLVVANQAAPESFYVISSLYGLTAINVVGLQPTPDQGGLLVQGLLDSL